MLRDAGNEMITYRQKHINLFFFFHDYVSVNVMHFGFNRDAHFYSIFLTARENIDEKIAIAFHSNSPSIVATKRLCHFILE